MQSKKLSSAKKQVAQLLGLLVGIVLVFFAIQSGISLTSSMVEAEYVSQILTVHQYLWSMAIIIVKIFGAMVFFTLAVTFSN